MFWKLKGRSEVGRIQGLYIRIIRYAEALCIFLVGQALARSAAAAGILLLCPVYGEQGAARASWYAVTVAWPSCWAYDTTTWFTTLCLELH